MATSRHRIRPGDQNWSSGHNRRSFGMRSPHRDRGFRGTPDTGGSRTRVDSPDRFGVSVGGRPPEKLPPAAPPWPRHPTGGVKYLTATFFENPPDRAGRGTTWTRRRPGWQVEVRRRYCSPALRTAGIDHCSAENVVAFVAAAPVPESRRPRCLRQHHPATRLC